MRKILYSAIATFCLMACDNISEEDRLIYEAPPTVNRSVLIEDFTGQRCVNCPNAAEEIHALQREYGDDAVIAVAIHGGPMAVYPNPGRNIVGLATETGDNYNEYWKVEQWPMGMVNRTGVCQYTEWKAKVREELQKVSPVAITVTTLTDNTHMGIDVTVTGTMGNTTARLQIWIVEDDIVALQLMPNGTANSGYVHQHVFRAAANGEWGEDISVKEGETVNIHADVNIPSEWKVPNLSAVVFVYNETGVLQVAHNV